MSPHSTVTKLDNPMSVEYLREHLSETTPRMILNERTRERLLAKLEDGDEILQNMKLALQKNARKILNDRPLVERTLKGKRLLAVSRDVLFRMNVLCMHYCITQTGNKKVLDRINQEILAVCEFKDWNPSHFLDVGEMCMGIALAVDWVGNDLPESTVTLAKTNLIEKGILPSFEGKHFWVQTHCNWNQVCHGGLIAAAIATAEVDPELAAKTLHRALDSMPHALAQYGPHGVYPEGSTYWEYGTSYSVVASSILETAFGTDFGIADFPAFQDSAMFRAMSKAPSGFFYNFSDCGDKHSKDGDLVLAWFAAKTGNHLFFEREKFLRDHQKMGKLSDFVGAGMIWLSQFEPARSCLLPHAWKGDGCNPVVFMTCEPDDECRYYFAGKGGKASNSHGNMDAGSFVFELDGVRWVHDPGNQCYNTLEEGGLDLWNLKQDSDRWKLLTKNNFGHSTLTVNDELHRVDGMATITDFEEGEKPSAEIDMTAAFGGKLKSARRKFTKDSCTSLLVEDALQLSRETKTITWQLITTADVTIKPFGAILKQDEKKLKVELLSEPSVTATVVSLDPPPFHLDRPICGLKRVEFKFPANMFDNHKGVIQVRLSRHA